LPPQKNGALKNLKRHALVVYLASYKARREGWQGLVNGAVQWLTKSQYSHTELCLGNPFENPVICISASGIDGGVRSKIMQLKPEHWDTVPMPWVDHYAAIHFLRAEQGAKYDYAGVLRFLLPWAVSASKSRWFCSEAVAAMVGLDDPWRFSPADLHVVVKARSV
jgi:hypothetical protein